MPVAHLYTNKSWSQSLSDLTEEFKRWDISDYVLPIKKASQDAGAVTLRFAVKGRWTSVECSRFTGEPAGMERNLRAIYLAINAVRKMDQRGLGALLFEAAKHLALESGSPDPYDVLRIPRTSNSDALKKAYRQRARETHPDVGGSEAEFRKVQMAAEELGIA